MWQEKEKEGDRLLGTVMLLCGLDFDLNGLFSLEHVAGEYPVYYVDYDAVDYSVEDADCQGCN